MTLRLVNRQLLLNIAPDRNLSLALKLQDKRSQQTTISTNRVNYWGLLHHREGFRRTQSAISLNTSATQCRAIWSVGVDIRADKLFWR
jgi:hypothetical protein